MKDTRMLTLLTAIPSTEPGTFYEFIGALGDEAPEKDDRHGWWTLFVDIEELEKSALIEVERSGRHIESLKLTEVGAARVREAQCETW